MNKLLVVQKKLWKFFFSTPIKNKKWSCQNNLFSANGSTRSYWESAVICCLPVIKMQITQRCKEESTYDPHFCSYAKNVAISLLKKKKAMFTTRTKINNCYVT